MKGKGSEQEKPQISVVKHYCKVCNRGFGCAGALGGHMRAHVIGHVNNNNGDDRNFRIKTEGNNANKQHSYFLRAKTPRFMGYQDLEDGDYKKASFNKNQKASSLMFSPPISKSNTQSATSSEEEEEDLANCLVMLSNRSYMFPNNGGGKEENKAKEVEKLEMQFQCKACKKVFNSHQALGGHRASHKKVKGCYAAKFDGEDNGINEESFPEHEDDLHDHLFAPTSSSDQLSKINNRTKMHECSVCRRVFSSGQALGGHKRCHWLTTSTDNAFITNLQYDHQLNKKPMFTKPHPLQDHHQLDLSLNFIASPLETTNQNGLTATTTPLCIQHWENNNKILHNNIKDLKNGEKESCDEQIKIKNKLSDLRDVNLDGGWLQMGIASTTDIY